MTITFHSIFVDPTTQEIIQFTVDLIISSIIAVSYFILGRIYERRKSNPKKK